MDSPNRQLDSSPERLLHALHSSGVGVWTWDVAANTIEADRNCSALFGLPAGQFPHTIEGVLALVAADDRSRVQGQMAASTEHSAEYNTEFHVASADGAGRSVVVRGRVQENEAGRPHQLTNICWGAGNGTQAEEAQQTATPQSLLTHATCRALLGATPDAMVVTDSDGKIVLLSDQVEKVFGYPQDELLGQTIELLIPPRFRDRSPADRMGYFADPQVRTMSADVELYALRKDGTEFPIEVSLGRVDTEDGVLVSSSIRDVSDRKRRERLLQSVVDRSDQERAERQTERDERQTERDVRQVAQNERQVARDELQVERDVRQVEMDERQVERDVRQVEMDERQVERDVRQVEMDERQVERDVRQVEMDERQVERDVRQSENVIRLEDVAAVSEAANRAKSAFLSTMSHEIRTPLNAILGYSQLMLRDPALGSEAQANVKIINRSGEHLLSLINDVLDMSKIEAGRVEINAVTFSLLRLLDDLEVMFRLRAESKALHFELLADAASVPYAIGDEGKIRQVLINLLGNAIKFTEHGWVKLYVTADEREAGQLWLSVRVEDTGSGLADEEVGRLFQPFVQTKGGLNTQQGTGLGLAISRQHARLMGGDVSFSARPGGGSAFLFEIPIEKGKSGVVHRQGVQGRVISLRAGQDMRRILVVDDHFENRNWLVKLLTAVGFSVRGANDGEEGVRLWREWNPRLILMDVHMPVMDGLEATRRIKAEPKGAETSIIILTASALDEERRASSQSGADDFLSKPCREEDLFESIRILLGVVFDYEEANADKGLVSRTPAWNVEGLTKLPMELLERLRDATESGDRKTLNESIVQVRDEAGDASAALALQRLADQYEYDALTRLLVEACQR